MGVVKFKTLKAHIFLAYNRNHRNKHKNYNNWLP